MKSPIQSRSTVLRNQSGQGLTEYITLLLLVSIFSIAAAKTLGGTIKKKIQMAERHIQSEITLEGGDSRSEKEGNKLAPQALKIPQGVGGLIQGLME